MLKTILSISSREPYSQKAGIAPSHAGFQMKQWSRRKVWISVTLFCTLFWVLAIGGITALFS